MAEHIARSMSRRRRGARRAAALIVLGLAVTGCQTNITRELSLASQAPDEFLTIRKQPLIVPPDMTLRPPAPGAPPLSSSDPRALARAGVTGGAGSPTATATTPGEQAILARAGADSGAYDPNIRRRLLRDQGVESKDSTLTNQLLRQERADEETLNARAESERLRQQYGNQSSAARNGGLLDSILGAPATN